MAQIRNRSLFEIDNDFRLPQPWVTPIVVNGNPFTEVINVRAFREAQLTVKPEDVDVVTWALLTEEILNANCYAVFEKFNHGWFLSAIVLSTGMGCVIETGMRVGELVRWVDAQNRKHMGVIVGFIPPRVSPKIACKDVLQRVAMYNLRFQADSVKGHTRALVCCNKLEGTKYHAVQLSRLERVES